MKYLPVLLVIHLHPPPYRPREPLHRSIFPFPCLTLWPEADPQGLHLLVSLVDWLLVKFSQWKHWQEIGEFKEREVRVFLP